MSSNNLPPSVLLDRLKNFLPQIAKANEELEERIKKEGQASVLIDANLVESNGDLEEEENEEANSDEIKDSKDVVQVEFALGDFDNSAIANIEDSISESKQTSSSVDDGNDSD